MSFVDSAAFVMTVVITLDAELAVAVESVVVDADNIEPGSVCVDVDVGLGVFTISVLELVDARVVVGIVVVVELNGVGVGFGVGLNVVVVCVVGGGVIGVVQL